MNKSTHNGQQEGFWENCASFTSPSQMEANRNNSVALRNPNYNKNYKSQFVSPPLSNSSKIANESNNQMLRESAIPRPLANQSLKNLGRMSSPESFGSGRVISPNAYRPYKTMQSKNSFHGNRYSGNAHESSISSSESKSSYTTASSSNVN